MSISRRTILSGIAASGLLVPVVASAAGADPAPAKAPAAAQREKKILFVLTSCNKIPETGNPTGYFYSEVSHPWKVLTDAGYEIDFVTPKGAEPTAEGFDPKDPVNMEFKNNAQYQAKLANTLKPAEVVPSDYCGMYYAGGHGAMWDLPNNPELQNICGTIYTNGGVIGAVCHGPAGLVNVKLPNGQYLVSGKNVNCFTNSEEDAVGMSNVVPFALETAIRDRGGIFQRSDNFQSHVVTNDRLVTGQNPASAACVGYGMLSCM
ncbi:type 1 glutamine amidotransferase domain-containing protein [Turicimonas muris]|uniref:type 1 glutamine amidotransferase domain-containing protein n=1 Tax=Turicimonas muris TaxID=1796652 RepID=UPI0023F40FA3|nr:type 1 glutamine amidotransferase domain-containing protein [Turicimonas muris]